MSIIAFIVLAGMITAYVLLDGFDLGIAAITPLIARTERERAASIHAIGPFWNGNEVWLIAAGGALFALFPKAYASSFSGFYLPFTIVLWLLMFRGIAIELREHFPTPIWRDFWDFCFTASSTLLVILFGIALGNLLRGVPLDAHGYFVGTFAFLLNPYALGVGIFAILALALHGATFLVLRVDGAPAMRALRLVIPLWWMVLLAYLAVTIATFALHIGHGMIHLGSYGTLIAAALVSVALLALLAIQIFIRRNFFVQAFLASSVFIGALLVATAATLYPYLLPSFPNTGGISIFDASPSPLAMTLAFAAIVIGLVITLVYSSFVFPRFFTKVHVSENHDER